MELVMEEKILIVDDDPLILESYRRGLGRQFRLDFAEGGREALEKVQCPGTYAVVVSDMHMPGMDGITFLSKLRELSPQTVRIMLTGNADQKVAINAVNYGQVFMFLEKPCPSETLASVLENSLTMFRQTKQKHVLLEKSTAEVKDLTQQLAYQSGHDRLTGLANRQLFENKLGTALVMDYRELQEHALCYLDVDHFHVINDTCGHAAGDELLRQLANILLSSKRRGDLAARLGVDSFGILFLNCCMDESSRLLERLRDEVRSQLFKWGDRRLEVNISLGLVPVTRENTSVSGLLSAAEAACDLANESGNNSLQVSKLPAVELAVRRKDAEWVTRIDDALREDRFRLFYQTIAPLDAACEEGDHFEILVRMVDEQGSLIPPGDFLPVAEQYHRAPRLDSWVIRAAAKWLGSHPNSLARLSMCSINLSGRSMGDQGVLDCILSVFNAASIPAQKICFEVTETATIANLREAVQFINLLKEQGFRFSLDDFGSGLSSFSYLRTLPVDYLKIDGAFVKRIDTDPIDRALVKSINEIGHVMGMKTIAEYVENDRILQQLKELHVDYAQGYYITPPLPLENLPFSDPKSESGKARGNVSMANG